MKQLLLIITSGVLMISYSCGTSNQEKETAGNTPLNSATATKTEVDAQSIPQNPTNEFNDIVSILKKDGIKYKIIKEGKEINISVSATVNSKFSDWTPAKVYSYLSGDDFSSVSTAINNNENGDFHYETKNIKFNVTDQTMTGGTYFIINKI